VNYRITVRSRIGSHSEVHPASHVEAVLECESVREATAFIDRVASRDGWRDFTLETIGDGFIPLGGAQ
jgi:hypothetical protein